jgi:hypothetical protein
MVHSSRANKVERHAAGFPVSPHLVKFVFGGRRFFCAPTMYIDNDGQIAKENQDHGAAGCFYVEAT